MTIKIQYLILKLFCCSREVLWKGLNLFPACFHFSIMQFNCLTSEIGIVKTHWGANYLCLFSNFFRYKIIEDKKAIFGMGSEKKRSQPRFMCWITECSNRFVPHLCVNIFLWKKKINSMKQSQDYPTLFHSLHTTLKFYNRKNGQFSS